MFVFGLLFFGIGAGFTTFTVIGPYMRTKASQTWTQTPCTITSSRVKVVRGDESDSYYPDLQFSYDVAGHEFESDQFDFSQLNRARAECKKIVAAYPAGKETVCYYDPEAPENAVIERAWNPNWLAICLPLIFSLVGGAVMVFQLLPSKNKAKAGTPPFALSGDNHSSTNRFVGPGNSSDSHMLPADQTDLEWDPPQNLKPAQTAWGGFVGLLLVSLFWNGIVSVFIYGMTQDNGGWVNWLAGLFLVPFVLVGLLMVLGTVHQFLAFFNPQIALAISTGAVARGASVDIAWEVSGNASRISNLEIYVEGQELATYTAGTDTHVASEVFERIPVVETSDSQRIQFGSTQVAIPTTTMHSFKAKQNEIHWEIAVRGKIRFWPDIYRRFPFRVKP